MVGEELVVGLELVEDLLEVADGDLGRQPQVGPHLITNIKSLALSLSLSLSLSLARTPL